MFEKFKNLLKLLKPDNDLAPAIELAKVVMVVQLL